jgi:elongator complex protein 2
MNTVASLHVSSSK